MKNCFLLLTVWLTLGTVAAAQKFDFGPGTPAKGYTRVQAADLYTPEKGFGFEPGTQVNCFDRGKKDALRSDLCTAEKPFYFSAAVVEGNYRVKITFGDFRAATATTVKAEL